MQGIQEDKSFFDGNYNWTNRGDEWSTVWGDPAVQWYGTR